MPQSYLQYLLDKGCALRLPVSGTMELTGRCNLSCRMCYIHQAAQDAAVVGRELETAQWLHLARQLQAAGTLTLLLTGGEPMLRQDFDEIYTRCKRLGFLLSVNTNATLLTPARFELLRQNRPLILNVSLYGASEETYFRLCGVRGLYVRVRANLLELRRLEIPVKLNYTVTAENFPEREAIFAFARENGISIQQTTYLFPPVRALCGGAGYGADALAARLRSRQDAQPETCGENTMHCRAGVSSFWITYDGALQACGMLPAPALNLRELPFAEAWARLKAGRDAIRLPGKCLLCAERARCEVCAAVCCAEGGFDEPPDYICRKTARYGALCEAFLQERPDAME